MLHKYYLSSCKSCNFPSDMEIHHNLMASNTSDATDTVSGLTSWDAPWKPICLLRATSVLQY